MPPPGPPACRAPEVAVRSSAPAPPDVGLGWRSRFRFRQRCWISAALSLRERRTPILSSNLPHKLSVINSEIEVVDSSPSNAASVGGHVGQRQREEKRLGWGRVAGVCGHAFSLVCGHEDCRDSW